MGNPHGRLGRATTVGDVLPSWQLPKCHPYYARYRPCATTYRTYAMGTYSHGVHTAHRTTSNILLTTQKSPSTTPPHNSQEECIPRSVGKVSSYFEVDESIWTYTVPWGLQLFLATQPKQGLTHRVGWVKQHLVPSRRLLRPRDSLGPLRHDFLALGSLRT